MAWEGRGCSKSHLMAGDSVCTVGQYRGILFVGGLEFYSKLFWSVAALYVAFYQGTFNRFDLLRANVLFARLQQLPAVVLHSIPG